MTDPIKLIESLKAAKSSIDTPDKWTKGHFARYYDGSIGMRGIENLDEHGNDRIKCRCILGSLDYAAPDSYDLWIDMRDELGKHCETPESLSMWNDDPERVHEDIMFLFDKTIKDLEEKSETHNEG